MRVDLVAIHKVRIQVEGGGSHDESVRVRTGGGGLKPSEYVHISTVYFPFLKIFEKEKMKMIDIMEVSLTLHLNS